MIQEPIQQFTKENIRFLTFNLDVSTEKLASLAQVDVSKLRIFQTYGYALGKTAEPMDDLIKLCNYFTIHLGDLMYTDLEHSSFDMTIFQKLKAEMSGGAPFDRELFEYGLLKNFDNDIEKEEVDLSIVENLKSLLTGIQQMYVAIETLI